jgi:HEAT repeat protein
MMSAMISSLRICTAWVLSSCACWPGPDTSVVMPPAAMPATTADPDAVKTHVDRLADARTRVDAIVQLFEIGRELAADPNDPRRAEFVATVLPAFAEIYATNEFTRYRDAAVEMALQMGQPEGAGIWARAIAVGSAGGIDGTDAAHRRALAALDGIQATRATAAASDVLAAFTALHAVMSLDSVSGQEGQLRQELAQTLGVLQVEDSVSALIAALETDESVQPKWVYKAAVDALGRIGDPAAVEALIAVQFTVADHPGTSSVGERAVRAIGAMGEAAVPKLIETLEGKNRRINDLALERGVDVELVQASAARMLGVVGSPKAVEAIVAIMPNRDCLAGGKPVDLGSWQLTLRAYAANALGYIGDHAAVDALCQCRNATHEPTDLFEISAALGRIGGEQAFDCLQDIVANNYYDKDAVPPGSEYEIRRDAARHLILAAPFGETAKLERVIARNRAEVRAEIEQLHYLPGIAVLDECKQDSTCYEAIMLDASREPFEREVAAVNFARLATLGDVVAAAKLARAWDNPDPEARVTIAWLTGKVAAGSSCPECVDELERVMKAEELSKSVTMQGAWLMALQTLAKVSRGNHR